MTYAVGLEWGFRFHGGESSSNFETQVQLYTFIWFCFVLKIGYVLC